MNKPRIHIRRTIRNRCGGEYTWVTDVFEPVTTDGCVITVSWRRVYLGCVCHHEVRETVLASQLAQHGLWP